MNRISFNWLLHQWKTIISLYLCRSVSVGDRVRVSVSECVHIDATLLTVFANNTHPLIHFSLNSSDETFPTESHSRPSNDRVQHEDCYSNDASIHVSTERFVNLFFSTKTAFFQRDKLFLFIKLLKNIPKKRIVKFQLCVRLIAMLNEKKNIFESWFNFRKYTKKGQSIQLNGMVECYAIVVGDIDAWKCRMFKVNLNKAIKLKCKRTLLISFIFSLSLWFPLVQL